MSKNHEDKKGKVKESEGDYLIEERFEIIEGIRYDFLSSPRVSHQMIVTGMYRSISTTCRTKGVVLVAPMDVELDPDNIVQPDVIFISNENLHIIQDDWIKGAPDLLVEVLSPSTGSKDKVRKKALYERFGIKEYWIVDPMYFTVDQFVLNDGVYQLTATYDDTGTLRSPYFDCISIELQELFQDAARFKTE